MRIYWFWPFVHPEDLVIPDAIPRADDTLVLHTMRDRVPAGARDRGRVVVRADLATVGDERERSLRWAAARSWAYAARSLERRRALRREHFDIAHVVFLNYFTDWFDLRALARRAPLVFEVHDVTPHHSRLPSRVEHAVLARQYDSPGTIIVRHEHVRDRLAREFDVDPARVAVVPWHVPEIEPAPETAAGDREHLTVLFFGTLRRNKGVNVLLRAIETLRDRTDLRFVFAGRGFADVEQAVADAAARDDRIVFDHGYVSSEAKHRHYRDADLVVLPYTEFESTSAVLCDAYSHRVPLVVTDVGALGDSVRAEQTGWVVPPGDADALAKSLVEALADTDGRRAAAASAATVAAARTPARIGAQVRDLYERVAGSRA